MACLDFAWVDWVLLGLCGFHLDFMGLHCLDFTLIVWILRRLCYFDVDCKFYLDSVSFTWIVQMSVV